MSSPREHVVLVHGLWMHGLVMRWLASRLERAGFATHTFSYRTTRDSIADNAARLADFIESLDAPTVHLVAHSLGGIVSLTMLQERPGIIDGRVVLLGSPVRGSRVAALMEKRGLGRLLGHSRHKGLVVPPEFAAGTQWQHDIGCIAGTRSIGPGSFLRDMPRPNDGTVALDETHLPGARDELQVPASHTLMLFSGTVATATAAFLDSGSFATASA
ncbi:MAG: alpha/beta fold hydrolase [Gammaproteobacteria bacterium]|nr:alpha/beta fold hydrolase [Gammaproteobacteria bacterium]